jgi:hypothetical protein
LTLTPRAMTAGKVRGEFFEVLGRRVLMDKRPAGLGS